MKTDTKKLSLAAIFIAMAYIVMLISKVIPEVAGFLQLDLKDVIIVIAGFILGPVYSVVVSILVAFIEFLTASNTGPIGMLMNIVSTLAFTFTASLVYSKYRSFRGAVCSLIIGTVVLTAVMLLWNYYITPLYMKVPRDMVAEMLPTVFLPFNLMKGAINTGITLIIYKPLTSALSQAGLLKSYTVANKSKGLGISFIIGLVILITAVPLLLRLMEKI